MVQIIKFPQYVSDTKEYKYFRKLFISGYKGSNWREPLFKGLENEEIVIFDPVHWLQGMGTDNIQEWLEWNFNHIRLSTEILFWISGKVDNMLTLLEVGHFSDKRIPIYMGCDSDYERKNELEIQMKLIRPKLKVVYDLNELVQQVREGDKTSKKMVANAVILKSQQEIKDWQDAHNKLDGWNVMKYNVVNDTTGESEQRLIATKFSEGKEIIEIVNSLVKA
jgi:hypothetical protein